MADKGLIPYYANQPALFWQDLVVVAIRRRALILKITLCGAILFTALALVRQPTYTANAKLLVTPRVADTPVSPEPNTSALAARGADSSRITAQLNSTVTMLTSPPLVEAALHRTEEQFPGTVEEETLLQKVAGVVHWVLAIPNRIYRAIHGVPDVSGVDAHVGQLLQTLVVTPMEEANMVDVYFTGESPAWSAGFVNALVETYLSPSARNGDRGASLKFFQEQRELLEKKFRDAQADLRDFRAKDAGDLAFADETELRSVRLQLQGARETADAELSAVTAQLSALEAEAKRLPRSLPVAAAVDQSPLVSELKAQVAQLEVEKATVASKYTENSVAMQDVNRKLATARNVLTAETHSATAALRQGGADMEHLTMQMVDARAQKAKLSASVAMLDAQIAEHTTKLDRLDEMSAEYQKLRTHLDAARNAYFTYLQKEEEARFATALNDSSVMNVVVASPAAVPILPDPSAMWLIILFGTVLSFGTGVGLVFLRDRMDPNLKSAFEAEQVAGLPVISILWMDRELSAGAAKRRGLAALEQGD